MKIMELRNLFDDWDIYSNYSLMLPSHSRLIILYHHNKPYQIFYSAEEFVRFMESHPL